MREGARSPLSAVFETLRGARMAGAIPELATSSSSAARSAADSSRASGDGGARRGEAEAHGAGVAHRRDAQRLTVLDDVQRPVGFHARAGRIQRRLGAGHVGDHEIGEVRHRVGDALASVERGHGLHQPGHADGREVGRESRRAQPSLVAWRRAPRRGWRAAVLPDQRYLCSSSRAPSWPASSTRCCRPRAARWAWPRSAASSAGRRAVSGSCAARRCTARARHR